MGQEVGNCYRCRRPLHEADFHRGMAVQVGSLFSCDGCAEPLLARLTPEQQRAILKKVGAAPAAAAPESPRPSAPPPEQPASPRPVRHATHRIPTTAGPPPRKQGVPPVVWFAVAGAIVLVLIIALALGSGDPPDPDETTPPPATTTGTGSPDASADKRGEELARQRKALEADIAALEKDVRTRSGAKEFQKALDALEAARPRHKDLLWTQAVNRLTREVSDALDGAFIRLKPKLQDALAVGAVDVVKSIQAEVDAWGVPRYREEVKGLIGKIELPPDEGLICWLKFDETSGTLASDAMKKSRRGKLQNGPTWRSSGGRIGGALAFDGKDDYVDMSGRTLKVLENWTVCAWVKVDQIGTRQEILCKEGGNKDGTHGLGYELSIHSKGEVEFGVFDGSGKWPIAKSGGDVVKASRWHHVAGVRDAKAGLLRVYVDGVERATGPAGGPPKTSRETVQIGRSTFKKHYLKGLIDDVRIYERALSAEAVRKLFEAGG